MKNLFTALADAQAEFMDIRKSSKAHNYKYAPLDVIRAAITPTLTKYGLVVIQFPISDDDKVGVRTILAHESGESVEQVFSSRLPKYDPQAIGSAITYFRRYALLACLGLAPEDEDDDAQHAMPERQEHRQEQRPNRVVVPVEQSQDTDLSNMTFGFGKFKGQQMGMIAKDELRGWLIWMQSQTELNPTAQDVVGKVRKYLERK